MDGRVTIKVEPNCGKDGPLAVIDALHQFLDAFEILSASAAQEPEGEHIKWRLVEMSKSSPALATAEAYSEDPSILIESAVRRTKIRLSDDLRGLSEGNVASWIEGNSRSVRALLKRNLSGVSRTVFDLGREAPEVVVVEEIARSALRSIRQRKEESKHSEFGSIDAHVAKAGTWRGQPALYVCDRLSNKNIPCVLSEKAAKEVGPIHSWTDAWSGRRVRVKGKIFYKASGAISRINASDVVDVSPEPVDFEKLRKVDLLQGATPKVHIDKLWGYTDE